MQLDAESVVMNNDDCVSVSSIFSDESGFHGDDEIQARYEARVAVYDVIQFWKIQQWNVQRTETTSASPNTHSKNRKRDGACDAQDDSVFEPGRAATLEDSMTCANKSARPFNPYEGCTTAKQLGESLDDFLTRLPPTLTTVSTGPWIWIANPHSKHRPLQEDIAGFVHKGNDLLESYRSRKTELEWTHHTKSTTSLTKSTSKDRIELEHDIHELAVRHNVMSGKWMLFCSPDRVDQVWATVAKHVLSGNLGSSAKVSTVDAEKKSGSFHLICIYTDDYSNLVDIKRVLRELRRSGLVEDVSNGIQNRPIYYKCDAYTYLDINSGNEFKIKASLYNSKDLFLAMKKEGSFL